MEKLVKRVTWKLVGSDQNHWDMYRNGADKMTRIRNIRVSILIILVFVFLGLFVLGQKKDFKLRPLGSFCILLNELWCLNPSFLQQDESFHPMIQISYLNCEKLKKEEQMMNCKKIKKEEEIMKSSNINKRNLQDLKHCAIKIPPALWIVMFAVCFHIIPKQVLKKKGLRDFTI